MRDRLRLDVLRAHAIVGLTALLAILRVMGCRSSAFQAIAHLHVGFLVGGACGIRIASGLWDRGCLYLSLGLSVVELGCFLLGASR